MQETIAQIKALRLLAIKFEMWSEYIQLVEIEKFITEIHDNQDFVESNLLLH